MSDSAIINQANPTGNFMSEIQNVVGRTGSCKTLKLIGVYAAEMQTDVGP